MPRKTKDTESKELEEKAKKEKKATTAKKSSAKETAAKKIAEKNAKKSTAEKKETATKKASTTKKSSTEKKATAKKTSTAKKTTTTKKTTSKKDKVEEKVKSETAKKASTKKAKVEEAADKKEKAAKKTAATKKTSTKKEPAVKKTATAKKTSTPKKTTTKKADAEEKKVAKKAVTKRTSKKTSSPKVDIVEYYDLPYRYNQTIVKVLAQTPTNLFIYWDISDADRENYKKQYGENFFETTKPILKIYNDTMHYDFEIEINDFANSWYLHVDDSKCDYRVELGRRPISNYNNSNNSENYIYISSSNEIESPNNRILFNTNEHMVYFRNVKNNSTIGKSMANFSFIRNMGKIYNIYDLYKKIYKDENLDNLNSPSSNFF